MMILLGPTPDVRAREGGRRPTERALGQSGPSHEEELPMVRVSKFTDTQKCEIALDLMSGKLSHAEVCRKYDISSSYAYKLRDRALDALREGVARPPGRPDAEVEGLRKRVGALEQLAGDQALLIREFKKRGC